MERLHKILLKDVMVKNPKTILHNERFSKVWDMFVMYKIRHLPVVDERNKVVGIVTQRDLYKRISPRKTLDGNFIYDKNMLDNYILENAMSKDVVTLSPEDTLGKLIDVMVKTKYGCISVVDEKGMLKGIMTQIDVLKAIREFYI